MPATRRSTTPASGVRKTRSVIHDGEKIQKPTTPQAGRKKAPQSVQNAKHVHEETPQGSSNTTRVSSTPVTDTPVSEPPVSGTPVSEGGARRSGRQRTVSKRLQDMELHFGSKKAAKRELEDDLNESTPKKKTKKQGLKAKSDTRSELADPAKSAPPKEDGAKSQVSPTKTPDKGTILDDKSKENSSDQQEETDSVKDSQIQSVPPKEQDASLEGTSADTIERLVLPDSNSEKIAALQKENENCVKHVKGESLQISQSESEEPAPVLQSEQRDAVQMDNVCSEEVAVADAGVVTDTVTREECTMKTESTPQPDAHPVITETPEDSENVMLVVLDTAENDLTKEAADMDDTPASCPKDESVKSSAVSITADTRPSQLADVVTPITIEPTSLHTAANTSYLNVNSGETNEVCEDPRDDCDNFNSRDANDASDKICIKEDSPPSPEVSEETPYTGGKDDCSETAGEGAAAANVVPSTENVAHLVMLEDGRQLLLSNADTLATAADAVASLGQMKEVSFVISNEGSESIPVISEADSSTLMVKELLSKTPKLNFVTVNTPVLPVNSTDDPAVMHECHLDMRLTPEGEVTAGPATVLSSDGFYRCSMCAYRTDKKANWYKHRYTHMATRRYKCDKCDHKATTSSNLKRHMLIHSDLKFFQCHTCGTEFRQKIHLERHIKYRHVTKMVKCTLCDYVCSSYNPDLKIHMKRRHPSEDDVTFRCETCGFSAASVRDLKQHQKFHRRGPELKLYCEQCSFVTDCESRLRRHLLVHNKQRPYWCSLCSYRGSQKEHVIRHLRTKHKIEQPNTYETVQENDGIVVSTIYLNEQVKDAAGSNSAETETPSSDASWMLDSQQDQEKDGSQHAVDMEEDDGTTREAVPAGVEPNNGPEVGQSDSEGVPQEVTIVLADHSVEDTETGPQRKEHPEPGEILETPADTEMVLASEKEEVAHTTMSAAASSISVASPASTKPQLIYTQQRKMTNLRKKYSPADFSSREKVFSCIHCTMKFAKLINLYKHLAVQHKDMHATKADGLHTCVWCEYQTNKWKNLLVHMRKHNYREEYGMASTRYACVVCTYSSQHRKALYAHMMKKHKIQIYVKPDGSASCVIDDTIPGTMSSTDGSAVILQRPRTDTTKPTDNAVVLTQEQQQQLAGQSSTLVETPGVDVRSQDPQQHGQTQTVMIELEPGMPATAVEILAPNRNAAQEDVDHEAADAIEGLQALAEQVMAVQQQQEEVQQAVTVSESEEVGEVHEREEQEECETESQIHIQDSSGQLVEGQNIQLTPEQLMQLNSGDYLEINGEVYKVEVAEDGSHNEVS